MRDAASVLPGRAVAAAAGVAAAGAGLWAFVTIHFHYEHALLAWAIGAGVGGLFHRMGGRGGAGAVLCVALTVAAIGVGKCVAVNRLVDQQREMVRAVLGGPETYAAMKANAEAFREAAADDEEEAFEEEAFEEEAFEEEGLEDEAAEVPDFPQTFEAYQAEIAKSMEIDETKILLESLTPIDALFFGLAVFSAWQLAQGRGRRLGGAAAYRTRAREPEETPRP